MSFDALVSFLDSLRGDPSLPFIIVGAFLVAGALFLPTWLLILQTGLLLPPPLSTAVALIGALSSSSLFYGVGRVFSGSLRRRFEKSARLSKATKAVDGAGLEHIIALRVLPVLPFTLINVSAGALGVRYRTFAGGTIIGMGPGIIAVTLLGDKAKDAFCHPTPASIALFVAVALVLVGVVTLMRHIAGRRA